MRYEILISTSEQGVDISIEELAETIKQIVGIEGDFCFNTSKTDGTMVKLNDPSILHALGWKHTVELEEGIKKMYEWYLLKSRKKMFNKKNILITGGTGSFGKKYTETILSKFKLNKIIIFSRDELKQYEMAQSFNEVFRSLKILKPAK